MSLKLRLSRGGSKKRPFYHIVVADSRYPRDGRYIEKVGSYNPMLAKDAEQRVVLKNERIQHWVAMGAQATERVALFLGKAGLAEMPKTPNRPTQGAPKAKAQERMKEQEAARIAAEEAAAEAAAQPDMPTEAPGEPSPSEAPQGDPSPTEAPSQEPSESPIQEPSESPTPEGNPS